MTFDTPKTLDDAGRNLLFHEAHTHYAWLDRPVSDAMLHELWDLVKMGPTGGNLQPLRLVFVKSAAAKEKLIPALMPQNQEKTRTAPVTVIVAHDTAFHRKADQLMPVMPGMADKIEQLPPAVRDGMARQSSTLQAGYLILAARALGLDVGPMGGFDPSAVDKAFFPDGKWATSLVINLGYGDESKAFPRQPRLSFDEAARIE
jgi:3-hydroxypropanoate dehydrogenase